MSQYDEHEGHQTLACLVLPNSKNNLASHFGIRVRGEISKVASAPRLYVGFITSEMLLHPKH